MNDHYFDSKTQICLGCDLSMSAAADGFRIRNAEKADPRLSACPSTATLVNDERAGILAFIVAPDRLVISDGNGEVLRLGPAAAQTLKNAIHNMRWNHG